MRESGDLSTSNHSLREPQGGLRAADQAEIKLLKAATPGPKKDGAKDEV